MGKKAMDMQSQILELLAETDAKHPGLRQLCGQMATILLALLLCRWLLNSYWMHLAHTLLTKTRRSVMKYKGPAPKAAVMRALECAIHAPNHWVNEPWRFRILGDEQAAKLSEMNPGKKDLFSQVPGFMVVSMVPTVVEGEPKWNMKSLEDHAACAAAIQNFMLSLASEGLGSKWMTGAMGIPGDKMLELVSASENEHYMGCIFFGQSKIKLDAIPAPQRKIGLNPPVFG